MTTPIRRITRDRRAWLPDAQPAPVPTPPPAPIPTYAFSSVGLLVIPTPDFTVPIPSAGSNWQQLPDHSGWWEAYNTAGGLAAAGGVLTATLPAGLAAGNANGLLYAQHTPRKIHYMRFLAQLSPGFEFNAAGMQKTHYAMDDVTGDIAFELYGSSAGCIFDCVTQLPTTGAIRLSTGRTVTKFDPAIEHQYETWIDYARGRIALGVDGHVVIDVSGLSFPATAGIGESEVYPGWGGGGAAKTKTDWVKYRNLFVAGL